MDPLTLGMLGSSALSGLANIGGGFISAGGASAQNETQRQANQMMQQNFNAQREDQRYFFNTNWERQQYNADTTWRRAVHDMKLAGINPMLAYQKGGNPAASAVGTSGAAAPTIQGDPTNPAGEVGRGLANGVTSALNAASTVQNFSNLNAQIQKTQAETSRTKAEEIKTVADTEISREMVKNPDVYRNLMRAQEHAAKEAAGASGAQAGLSRTQTLSEEQKARRTEQFGDSVLGNNLNSVQQMLRHLFNTVNNLGGISAANRGADRVGNTAKQAYEGVKRFVIEPAPPASRQSGYETRRRKF